MKELPILFSTPMVQAIMEDRKTQTRRIVKATSKKMYYSEDNKEWLFFVDGWGGHKLKDNPALFSRWKPGDLLYVRETWAIEHFVDYDSNQEEWFCIYKADYPDGTKDITWRPSIHMAKGDARIWLRVTDVSVERLCDISPDDCFAEGIDAENNAYCAAEHYQIGGSPIRGGTPERFAYFDLWDSINGPESVRENPWVWVISFEVVSKTGKV